MALLRPTFFFQEVQRYLAVIKEGKRSGMKAHAKRPTFVVGRPTWQHSALWYAGTIAHDAYHSKLYHEAKDPTTNKPAAECWTGTAAERKCLAFQVQVLQSLHADENTVAYVRELEKNPTNQSHNRGWKGWRDYWRRWW
jgi:hypothetical protein